MEKEMEATIEGRASVRIESSGLGGLGAHDLEYPPACSPFSKDSTRSA